MSIRLVEVFPYMAHEIEHINKRQILNLVILCLDINNKQERDLTLITILAHLVNRYNELP